MKLHRLEIEGFGPFRQRQHVDFDAFDADGIFLITGKTGAGKSSILDAVCFALYGQVPRFEQLSRSLRSDHCLPQDRSEVVLEFTASGIRWRISRSPEYERAKQRGEGLTLEKERAVLLAWEDGAWVGKAASPRAVGILLNEVIGLTQQQFLQVILLAQNRFQRFLLAGNQERQELLRSLFGSQIWRDYREALDERRRQGQTEIAAYRATVETLLSQGEELLAGLSLLTPDESSAVTSASRRAALERGATQADARVAEARDAAARASEREKASAEALSAVRAVAAQQQDRQKAREWRDALQEKKAQRDREEEVLEGARAAELLRPLIERHVVAEGENRRRLDERQAAEEQWLRVAGDHPVPDEARARRLVEELAAEIARCGDALTAEEQLPQLEEQIAQHEAVIAGHQERITQLDSQRQAVPQERARLATRLAQIDEEASAVGERQQRHEHAELRLAAAERAAGLAERRAQAERDHLAAVDVLTARTVEWNAVLRRRIASAAADLAAGLVDGEPCVVCGATSHPAPAVATAHAATDDDVAAAEAARDAAQEAVDAQKTSLDALRQEEAAARAEAGHQTVAEAREAREHAHRALVAAQSTAEERRSLQEEDAALQESIRILSEQREELATAETALRVEFAAADEQRRRAQELTESARGDARSVSEHVAQLDARREAARLLADAQAAVIHSEDAVVRARGELDAALADSSFSDAAAASDAIRDQTEQYRLAESIRAFDDELAAARSRLAELQALSLPAEPVAVDVAEADHAAAATAARAAVEKLATERAAAESLHSVIERLIAADATAQKVLGEHEVVESLALVLAGRGENTLRMDLETFVLAAELEDIVAAANVRLHEMSAGRYLLQHTDARAARGAASGLGLEVLDAFTGRPRPPQSLSGGESFLASLALALGLAEVVTARAGGIRLDTLFIDEGFGSLDPETLQLAMDALDALRAGGRTVGVISHVEAMKEWLNAQLTVVSERAGPSSIRQFTGEGKRV